jgi:hypothetical protein
MAQVYTAKPVKLQGKRRSMSISTTMSPADSDEGLDKQPYSPLVPDISIAHKAMIRESIEKGLQEGQQRELANADLREKLYLTCRRRDEVNRASEYDYKIRQANTQGKEEQLARQESKRKKFSRAFKSIFVNDQTPKPKARPIVSTQQSYHSMAKQLAELEQVEDAADFDRHDSYERRDLARM